MSDETKPNDARSLSIWKLIVIGIAGMGLGKMLAAGIMPFQPVPFEKLGVSQPWAIVLFGWALAVGVEFACDLHAGVSAGSAGVIGKVRRGLAAAAHWVATKLKPAETAVQTGVVKAAEAVEQVAAPKVAQAAGAQTAVVQKAIVPPK
jgi:hypothetical protein